jgi:hypothetical protein
MSKKWESMKPMHFVPVGIGIDERGFLGIFCCKMHLTQQECQ